MAAPITASQMRKIHVSARERGMDNDLLHIYVSTLTGKDSLRELTISEAVKVIDSLEGRTGDASAKASYKQIGYIHGLMRELGWVREDGKPDEDRLNGFLRKRCGVDHWRWLSRSAASKVIEALKNMAQNQGKQAK